MMTVGNRLKAAFVALTMCFSAIAYPGECPTKEGVYLQVLGSGGPIADDGRASSGYIVWVDGRSVVLIDAGGGSILRFAEAGASFNELDFIGLSHFHADHSADFPALLKDGYFSDRNRSLIVTGPDGQGPFPGLKQFLTSLLDEKTGAFGYLAGYLDGSAGLPNLAAFEINDAYREEALVLGDVYGSMQIDALHVPHGIVPTLAFRVRVGENMLVFGSDQDGSNPEFVEFAKNATVLVMHMPVPEGVKGVGRMLHAAPSVIGKIAHDADAKMLVLSHFMERSLRHLDQNVDRVRSEFSGPIKIAKDLACYRIMNQENEREID